MANWSFGDGQTGSGEQVAHLYASAGDRVATLTVTDDQGFGAMAATTIHVLPPGAATVETYLPEADTVAHEGQPQGNFGQSQTLAIRQAPGGAMTSYVRFQVTGAEPATQALLRLTGLNPGSGGDVATASDVAWGETTLTFSNAPPADGGVVGSFATLSTGENVIDVTPAIAGPGPVTLVVRSAGADQATFGSRERAGSEPVLEVHFAGAGGAGRIEALPGLLVGKGPTGSLTLGWSASCSPSDTDYAVYMGTIGSFEAHAPLACGTGGQTTLEIATPAPDTYVLIVPLGAATEGSYGLDGAGQERPAASSACLPRQIAACPE